MISASGTAIWCDLTDNMLQSTKQCGTVFLAPSTQFVTHNAVEQHH